MHIEIVRADPAGNITLLVTSKVPEEAYGSTAQKLLELQQFGGEQVGFLSVPEKGGQIKLAMMGGEFCGNALRSAGFYCASTQGLAGKGKVVIPVETSGCDRVLKVSVDVLRGEAYAEMPVPLGFEKLSAGGRKMDVVIFDGIVHAILAGIGPDAGLSEFAGNITARLVAKYNVLAAGVLFLDLESLVMQPAVFVRDTETLVFENSCASGSSAVAAFLSQDHPDGSYEYDIIQPGGIIRAAAEVKCGQIMALTVGGRVELGEEFELEI